MSMQALSGETLKVFPDQNTIATYINNHSIKKIISSSEMQDWFPDSITVIAQYFANQKIPSDTIAEHVKTALIEKDTCFLKELVTCQTDIEGRIIDAEKSAGKETPFSCYLKTLLSKAELPLLNSAITAYTIALEQL